MQGECRVSVTGSVRLPAVVALVMVEIVGGTAIEMVSVRGRCRVIVTGSVRVTVTWPW